MSVDLPPAIAAYFAADKGDGDAVARCFADQAIVRDEGRVHQGHDAIRRWKAEASARYDYTSEPTAVHERDGAIVVTAHVAGSFPGSPIDLRYAFTLDGGRIASLEIGA